MPSPNDVHHFDATPNLHRFTNNSNSRGAPSSPPVAYMVDSQRRPMPMVPVVGDVYMVAGESMGFSHSMGDVNSFHETREFVDAVGLSGGWAEVHVREEAASGRMRRYQNVAHVSPDTFDARIQVDTCAHIHAHSPLPRLSSPLSMIGPSDGL